jgi:hypothetical protein
MGRTFDVKNNFSKYFFELCCYVALIYRIFPRGFNTRYYLENITLWDTAQEVREKLGGIDAGQLLDVSLTFSTFNDLDPDSQFWIARVWSMGISVFQVPAIWLQSLDVPFSMTIMLMNLTIWSILLRILFKCTQELNQKIIISILWVSFLYSYDGNFLFREFPFNSEVIGIGLMLISLALVVQSMKNPSKNWKTFIVPGVTLGVSICVRYTIDYAVVFVFLISVMLLILIKGKSLRALMKIRTNNDSFESYKYLTSTLKYFALTFGVALIVTLPLRITNQINYGGAPLQMSSAQVLTGPNLWAKSETAHAKYWDKTGMNWACDLDPSKCYSPEIESKQSPELFRMAVFVAIRNPIEFIQNRIYYIWHNHSLELKNNYFWFIYSLFHLSLIFVPFFLFKKFKYPMRSLIFILWLPFIALQYLTYLIIHFETRYFVPLHLMNLGLLWSASILNQKKRAKRS